VSTTPIREALHKLASEGLVDFDAGRGALVHVLSQSEWNEIIDIRDQLEPFALRRAAERIDDQTLARMEQIHQAMADASDSALWVDLNRQFHHLYYRAAGLPRLEAILGALQDASATYVAKLVREYPDFRPIGHGEHAAIVEHLRNHDWNALEKVIRIHIRPSAFDYEY
jgi:DNA-binding GntR family transcriptional regulator